MQEVFWEGKKVFLTGHTGFKGAWLTLWLHQLGAKTCGFALAPPTTPNLYTIAGAADTVVDHRGDIRDLDAMRKAMVDFAPDILIHMAAQPLVRDSYKIPIETFDVNVMGTVKVLEAARSVPSLRATVIVTTDKCYENREVIWGYRETDAMGGYDPYSSSKGCAELATAAYARSYFQPETGLGGVASVRAGNVIGGGDWAHDRLMADLMRGLMAGEEIVIRSPHALRPWQHVLEPLSGYMRVAQRLFESGPSAWESWNFGPNIDSERDVETVARLTCKLWGRPEALRIVVNPDAPHEAHLLKLDATKARTYLDWQPRWNFEQSIANTVAWYRAFADGADMRAFTLDQIKAYGEV